VAFRISRHYKCWRKIDDFVGVAKSLSLYLPVLDQDWVSDIICIVVVKI
jgi:hypothetical protein